MNVEAILADFRAWLEEAKAIPTPEPVADLDVATVVQHFTALRQEVNLQTKASRAQVEQNAQTIALLQQALEGEAQEVSESDELLRPLLKTLIDTHDALALAEREVRKQLANPAPPTEQLIETKLPFYLRWLGFKISTPPSARLDPHADRYRQALDALLVGYAMSLKRLERAIEQNGLEAIPCVGEPFDPETMEVAEVVREEGRTSTEVLQEIRRGYLWQGRLFRCAQVRVARP